MKNAIIAVLLLIILAGGGFYFYSTQMQKEVAVENPAPVEQVVTPPPAPQLAENQDIIGRSVEGRDINSFTYGTGEKNILFVGGIHGGYEWNTVSLAYALMDYLEKNPTNIPANVKVTVVPVLNPDGLFKVVGSAERFEQSAVPTDQAKLTAGRFNANNVDLNRNFDCEWQPTGMWRNTAVDGGSEVFSEPESIAMKTFVEAAKPTAVVGFYSAAGGVYSSACGGSILPVTKAMTSAYAKASGYPAYDNFDSYAITGDMINWLAKSKIPAISVLLTNHTDVEWEKNQKGIEALLAYFAK